jgi:uncharacterized membrane protein
MKTVLKNTRRPFPFYWDLSLAIAVAVFIAFIFFVAPDAQTPVIDFAKNFLGVPFVLLVPGYALAAILFMRKTLSNAERLMYAIGFSVAMAIFAGMMLNFTTWGITRHALAAVLSAATVILAIIAWLGRSTLLYDDSAPEVQGVQTNLVRVALYGASAAVVAFALYSAATEARRTPPSTILQFWALPVEDGSSLRVGGRNFEFPYADYRLEIRHGNQTLVAPREFSLNPGETREITVTLTALTQIDLPVEAMLYRADAPGVPFRQVTYWPSQTHYEQSRPSNNPPRPPSVDGDAGQ